MNVLTVKPLPSNQQKQPVFYVPKCTCLPDTTLRKVSEEAVAA